MIDMQELRDAESEKLFIALASCRNAAKYQRRIAALWQDANVQSAKARHQAACKSAEEAEQKAGDIERLIQSITTWGEQEAAKHR